MLLTENTSRDHQTCQINAYKYLVRKQNFYNHMTAQRKWKYALEKCLLKKHLLRQSSKKQYVFCGEGGRLNSRLNHIYSSEPSSRETAVFKVKVLSFHEKFYYCREKKPWFWVISWWLLYYPHAPVTLNVHSA